MSEAISDWRRYLENERERAPATVRLYTTYLQSLAADVGDPVGLQTEDLRAWLQQKRGSAATVGNRIAALKSFFQFLLRRGIREDDPSADLQAPKRRPAPPQPVADLQEVLKRLDDIDRRANHVGAIPRRVGESRDMAIFLAETGLRISDAVICNWPVPCPTDVTIRIGRRKENLVVSDEAREAWNRLGGKWPVGARATQRRFEKAEFHPHQLRHWHKAYKRPMAPGAAAASSSTRSGLKTLLHEIAADYSAAERSAIVDFLSRVARAIEESQPRKPT